MVGEFLAPEAIIAEVARRHDIHPNKCMAAPSTPCAS
jgi:transposase-like protein